MTKKEVAKLIDHTQLKAYASLDDFKKLCEEALENDFMMVAINSYPVKMCKKFLENSNVHVGAAIAFPLGQTTIEVKKEEVIDSIKNGCDEIDYVINISKVKEKDFQYIENEMREIVEICKENNIISKVIFENCYLTREEIIEVAKIAKKIKPDFIKTSTGFGTSGATVEDVKLMKSIVGNDVKVKAAGGIRDLDTLYKMIEAGAERIGTSAGVEILKEYDERNK